MAINIQETSELLCLHPISVLIYIELLTLGALSKSQIVKFIDKPKLEIVKGLDELTKKNLIHKVKTSKGKEVFESLSILQLNEHIDREKEMISNLQNFIVTQIQQPQKLGIIKYDGWEGIRRIYMEVLEEAIDMGEPILAFENIPDKDNSPIGKVFLENYLEKRFENHIFTKIIAPDNPASRQYKANEKPFTEIIIIKDLPIKGTINIVGDLVMSYSTDPIAQGTLRRDHVEAYDLKQIFQYLWKINQG